MSGMSQETDRLPRPNKLEDHSGMSPEVLRKRVEALHADLSAASPDTPCGWPLARVFNALLAETRAALQDDPIVTTIGSIKVQDKSTTVSQANNGTVRALAGQLIAALSAAEAAPVERPVAERSAA
jgi:hypothetical protein